MTTNILLHTPYLRIAMEAHGGQSDKAGQPYIGHVLRVATHAAELSRGLVDPDLAFQTGLLHDVVEDTHLVILDLERALRLPLAVRDAVVAMTHPKGEPYQEYIDRVAANRLATVVKIADIRDNLSIPRLNLLPEETRTRLFRKYEPHLARLEASIG